MSRVALKVSATTSAPGLMLSVADLRGWLELWDAVVHQDTDEAHVYPRVQADPRTGQLQSISAEVPGYGTVSEP